MRIQTRHRTLSCAKAILLIAATSAIAGCQSRTVSIPSNEPLVTTSPKLGTIGQSQLPTVAAATGQAEVKVAAQSNSWVLRHINAGLNRSKPAARPEAPTQTLRPLADIPAPPAAKSTGKFKDVSLADIPLIDPAHYDPRRVR